MNKSRILKALSLGAESMAEEVAEVAEVAAPAEGEVVDAAAAAPAEAAAAEVVEAAPVAEEPEMIEQAAEEVAEAAAEVEADTQVVEDLDEAAATLESIYDALQDVREEGLTPQAARFAGLAIESVTNRLGVEEPVLPSLESFQGHTKRVEATTLSVEQVGKKIAEIWAAIMKWLMQIKESVLNFLKTHLTKLGRVKARADKLEAAAKAAKGKAKADTVDATDLAPRVVIGTDLPKAPGQALTAVLAVLKDAETYGKKAFEEAQGYRTWLTEAAASGNTEGLSRAPKTSAFVAPAAFKHESKEKGGTIYKTDVLPGNVVFFVGHRASALANLTLDTSVSGKEQAEKVAFDGKWEVKVDLAATKTLIAKVQEVLAAAEKASNAASAEVAKTKEQFKAVRIGAEADDKVSMEDQAKLRLAMRAYKNAEAEVGKAVSRIAAYAVDVSNDFLTLAQKQLAQFG